MAYTVTVTCEICDDSVTFDVPINLSLADIFKKSARNMTSGTWWVKGFTYRSLLKTVPTDGTFVCGETRKGIICKTCFDLHQALLGQVNTALKNWFRNRMGD